MIGVMPQEREVGNDFCLDVRLSVDAGKFVSENIETTVSYADIYDIIADEMSKQWLLLESVAKEIAERILRFKVTIQDVDVKITKLSVPITGIDGFCSVEYCAERHDLSI